MKSSHTSISPLRRALVAATVVLAAGSVAAFAQSSSSQDSTMRGAATTNTNNDQSMTNSSTDQSNMNATSNASSMNNDQMANAESSNRSSDQKLSWGDRRFVEKAAQGGQSEVALGQLAQEKASNPDVKAYGQSLVQDHQNANQQLMQIAQQKNVKLKEDKSKDDREYKRLAKASGDQFDREFIQHAVKDHEKDIKMFEKEAKDAKDPEVRNFAAQVLPKLREHLAMAQRLQQSIVPTGRTGPNSWRSDAGSSSSGNATMSTSQGGSTEATGNASSGANTGASTSSTASTR